MKKSIFILIIICMISAPLWAQKESDFRGGFTSDGGIVIRGYTGSALQAVIPDTLQYMPVKEIGRDAFRSGKITSIVIPEGVTHIRDGAFADCKELSSVILPGTLTSIGEAAFDNCVSLSAITLPDSLTIIGVLAFRNCASLSTVKFPVNIYVIGGGAFQESGLTSVSWPAGIRNIPPRAFYNCKNLQSAVIPEGVTVIGSFAFYGCSGLTAIALPGTISRINEGSFNSCSSLTSVTVPASVRSINFSEQEPETASDVKSFAGSKMSSASQGTLKRVGYTGGY